ncbi:ASCH domain-containing protein, partial [Streptococcus suis]|uniref:ASCH domain-containing protein n=3 Tax=Streptococcus suis TaxID=1307 RepID=UPI000A4B819B
FYTQKGSIISTVVLPTTEIIEPKEKSLIHWRQVHEELFTIWLAEAGLTFTDDMLVVCEEFELVYPK